MSSATWWRRYLVSLIIPTVGTAVAVGCAIADDLFYQDIIQDMMDVNELLWFRVVKGTAAQTAQRGTAYLLLMIGIYGSCAIAAFTNERYHRSLFTVHTVRVVGFKQTHAYQIQCIRLLMTIVLRPFAVAWFLTGDEA